MARRPGLAFTLCWHLRHRHWLSEAFASHLRQTADAERVCVSPGRCSQGACLLWPRGLGLTDQWCPGPRLAGAWERRPALRLQTPQHGVPWGRAAPPCSGGQHPARPAQRAPRRPGLMLSWASSGTPGGADRLGHRSGGPSGRGHCFLEVRPAAPRRVPQPASELFWPQEFGPFLQKVLVNVKTFFTVFKTCGLGGTGWKARVDSSMLPPPASRLREVGVNPNQGDNCPHANCRLSSELCSRARCRQQTGGLPGPADGPWACPFPSHLLPHSL